MMLESECACGAAVLEATCASGTGGTATVTDGILDGSGGITRPLIDTTSVVIARNRRRNVFPSAVNDPVLGSPCKHGRRRVSR